MLSIKINLKLSDVYYLVGKKQAHKLAISIINYKNREMAIQYNIV